jgi:hypothetical protein
MIDTAPIVVTGTGGSGTRAVAEFCTANGVYMGTQLNGASDAMAFVPALSGVIDPILSQTRSLDYSIEALPERIRTQALSALEGAIRLHLDGWPGRVRWGCKNPRQIFVLPILAAILPNLTLVHVVRDGRDMLLSRNQNQPRQHYSSLFNQPWLETPKSIGQFWGVTNLQVARVGARLLGKRYVRVRIEDLCASERSRHVAVLASALDFDPNTALQAASVFEAMPSFGRGQELTLDQPSESPFNVALRTFGYIEQPCGIAPIGDSS